MEENNLRNIDEEKWNNVIDTFNTNDDSNLVNSLLDLDLFPIKDPYVRYLKKDRNSIERNPETVKRLADQIREFSIDELRKKCEVPKESNRQMGQLFNNWVKNGNLGSDCEVFDDIGKFANSNGNRCFVGGDEQKRRFVSNTFDHELGKGFDLLVVFNDRFVFGEAKLITDFGGHQDRQYEDAIRIFNVDLDVERVAVVDGVIYIDNGKNKMQRQVREDNRPIMSALVLREFLESL